MMNGDVPAACQRPGNACWRLVGVLWVTYSRLVIPISARQGQMNYDYYPRGKLRTPMISKCAKKLACVAFGSSELGWLPNLSPTPPLGISFEWSLFSFWRAAASDFSYRFGLHWSPAICSFIISPRGRFEPRCTVYT